MFKATLTNTGILTDSIATIAEIIDEGIFRINQSGISLIAADRAMVAVVDFKLSSSAFEKFEIDNEQKVGMNLTNLLSVLKRASGSDKATFSLTDSRMEITMEGESRRRFVVPIFDLSQEEIPPIDQLEFSGKVSITPEILHSGISDAEVVADAVQFEASDSGFGMRAEGDISKAELELEKGNKSLMELVTNGQIRARYPIDYLKKMIKAAKVAEVVDIHWGQDYPMKLNFKSGDKVSISFILAPRVVEE